MCIFQVSSAKVNMLHGKSNGSLTSSSLSRTVRIFPLFGTLFIEIYLFAFIIRVSPRPRLERAVRVEERLLLLLPPSRFCEPSRSSYDLSELQQSNRVTMKLDVSYTDHSHIIGKGGLTIKRVMEETGCHIHFPDSNRSNHQEKSNQVSIAGEMEGVERARARVRVNRTIFFLSVFM